MPTENEVLDALRTVIDPDLGQDIVSAGFVKDLEIDRGDVRFTVELTTPACPLKQQFRDQCEQVVQALPDVETVSVNMTARARERATQATPSALDGVDFVVAVSSCKGGVGKSTIAAHLARAMQRQGLRIGLLDTDIYGPSFPTLFDVHRPQVMASGDRIVPVDIDGLKVMSLGFLLGDAPAVMRGPRVSAFTQQILTQTAWGELHYLIIDMPPGTGDIQLTLVQQTALDGAIIVTTPQTLSLVDVTRGILMFETVNVPVLGIVENMSYFVCDNCGKTHHIFGEGAQTIEKRFGLTTLAQIPVIAGISDLSAKDAGADLGVIKEMADNVHREVGKRRAQKGNLPEAKAEEQALRITWPDGTSSVLPNKKVRAACRCAQCMDENTGEQVLDPATVPDDIRIERVQPLGNYAVSIAWSDGHSSGIYSWDYLRELATAQDESG